MKYFFIFGSLALFAGIVYFIYKYIYLPQTEAGVILSDIKTPGATLGKAGTPTGNNLDYISNGTFSKM